MAFFLCRLLPPRPSFAADMNEAERAAMGAHAAYFGDLSRRGQVVVFGLVADPAGPWGVAVLEVADEGEAQDLTSADPAIRAGIGLRYEIHPMPLASARPARLEQAGQNTERTP
jgi:uncharacterized protein YciI